METLNLEPLQKLTRDLRTASEHLSDQEARYLVDSYYQMQDNRIRTSNQIRSMEGQEPHMVIAWLQENAEMLENQVKAALGRYAKAHKVGEWAMSQKGIGPVIAAGLLAHIDIHKAQTAGAIWKYAGQDPSAVWEKGQKRPWNASLKVLCWKLGESFVKVSGKDDAFYGRLYAERKALELQRNERLEFKEQAEAKKGKVGKSTDAYKWYSQGMLPPAHIHARAKRYAVKIFLSHLFEVWREAEGLEIPKPFALAHLDHVHKIGVPR